MRRSLAAGDLKVVCNVVVLTARVDWDVRCIILARPTKSEMLFVQIIGRRTAEGARTYHTDTQHRVCRHHQTPSDRGKIG